MSAIEGPHENSLDEAAWQQAMGDKGWQLTARLWRRRLSCRKRGGRNAARRRAWNPIGGMGVMMFGPTPLE